MRLGAIDAAGVITATGRLMQRFPVHPRQARMLVEAESRGVGKDACVLAALVGQRPLRLERRGGERAHLSGPSDLLADLECAGAAARARSSRRFGARRQGST